MMRLAFVLAAAVFLSVISKPGLTDAESPQARIEAFHAQLLTIMKTAESLGIDGRYDRIRPEVRALFDLRLMVALASGAHWRKAGKAQRQKLIEAFGNFSAATYASRFDGFSGQKFSTLAVKEGPRGTRIVHTRIESPDRDPVAISYVMRKSGGGWRIADILLVGGISEIATRRSEYRTILNAGGPTALVSMLTEKTQKLLRPD